MGDWAEDWAYQLMAWDTGTLAERRERIASAFRRIDSRAERRGIERAAKECESAVSMHGGMKFAAGRDECARAIRALLESGEGRKG